jgi:hypothetical protein
VRAAVILQQRRSCDPTLRHRRTSRRVAGAAESIREGDVVNHRRNTMAACAACVIASVTTPGIADMQDYDFSKFIP